MLSKYIFYETNKSVGICPKVNWEEYKYYNEIKPIQEVVVTATVKGIKEIISYIDNDINKFIETVREELQNNLLTITNN